MVTVPQDLDAVTGLRPGDHLWRSFAGDTDLAAAIVPFLDEGRRRDEQLLLVGCSRPALLAAVSGLPHRDALLAVGRLVLQTTGDACSPDGGPVATDLVQRHRGATQAALDAGRTGLRVAVDVTGLLRRGRSGRRLLHACGQFADETVGAVPVTVLCLYDASVGPEALGPVAVLHPVQHPGDRPPLARLSGRGPVWSLHGEVDLTEAVYVATALVDVAGDAPGEVVVDLSGLAFLDVAGARALHSAAGELAGRGIALRLAGAHRSVRRCLDLFDLDLSGSEQR
ncbi:anti-anti-sigma factor [Geodermatophilus amargosae]|uniref:Anti-anti-sigma factor n=1 Tax=Geodermatophilus amargosae TaxID=1296565 RepID=A0A1I6Z2W7_9ACTN|nr:anti-anti-sigma factor [Geodermatophilus amargosae]